MKKRIKHKALIFDMDGTIVDTNLIWDNATQKLLQAKGVSYTPQLHTQLREMLLGCNTRSSCLLLKQMFNIADSVDALVQEKKAYAHEGYTQGIQFIEGFLDFHAKVAHIPKSIATNADDRTLQLTQQALQLDRYFGEHMYGISHVNHVGKPDPAIFLHAAARLGYAPEDCVVIEDSATGIKAAQAAGMYCIGINTHGDKRVIAQADAIVEGYHEIDFLEYSA